MRYPNQRVIAVVLGGLLAAVTMAGPARAGAHPRVPRPMMGSSSTVTPGRAEAAPMIPTRRSVAIARARTWLTAWHGGPVPYSQSRYLGGWRTDCSGYVSMAWNLQTAGGAPLNYNTDSMLRGGPGFPGPVVHPIGWGDLRAGDAIGFLGAGSAGDAGHVMLFERWADPAHTTYWVYEQAGDGGTHHRTHRVSYNHYRPYRYNRILEG